ncbi:MAG: LPS export ABC transporter permease LptF [Oligoflexia bacterium]|nr:LPS export ABC transporter permease LptF [Oligoflexia bacterium]
MRKIDRYIFRECTFYFTICVLGFTTILLTIRMLKFAALIINRGVAFSQIGMVFVSAIPTFLEIAVPLSTLLGIMLAFGRLSGDSEVIVMRASGISILSLIRPVFAFGIISALLTLLITVYVSPWGFRKLSATLFEIASSQSLAGLEPGVFNTIGALTIYADEIKYDSNSLGHVMIDDRRSADSRRVIVADSGLFFSDESRRSLTLSLKNGMIHEIVQGKYVLTNFITNNLVVDSEQMSDGSSKKGPAPRELPFAELNPTIARYSSELMLAPEEQPEAVLPSDAPVLSNDQMTRAELLRKIARLNTEKNRRTSMPFAAFILALIALPLGIQVPRTQRAWGVGLSVCLGMAVFVVYYALLSIGVALSEGGRIGSLLGLWIPNIGGLMIAVLLVQRVGSERWHSIPHALELFAQRFFLNRRIAAS